MSGDQLSQLRDDRISQGPWVCRTKVGDETRPGVPGFMELKLMEPGGYIHLGCPCTRLQGVFSPRHFLIEQNPTKTGFSRNHGTVRKTAADPPSTYAKRVCNDFEL